jgi:hypothetical protein
VAVGVSESGGAGLSALAAVVAGVGGGGGLGILRGFGRPAFVLGEPPLFPRACGRERAAAGLEAFSFRVAKGKVAPGGDNCSSTLGSETVAGRARSAESPSSRDGRVRTMSAIAIWTAVAAVSNAAAATQRAVLRLR